MASFTFRFLWFRSVFSAFLLRLFFFLVCSLEAIFVARFLNNLIGYFELCFDSDDL